MGLNHSRSQRGAYSHRRPMPLRVREGRQKTEGRKRPMKETGQGLADGGLGTDEDEGAIPHASERRR